MTETRQPLSKNELDLARIIQEFWQVHGYSPSFKELAVEMDIASVGGIARYVRRLKEKGWLHDFGKRQDRALRLTGPVAPAPVDEPGALLERLAADVLRETSRACARGAIPAEAAHTLHQYIVEFGLHVMRARGYEPETVEMLANRLPVAIADSMGRGPARQPADAEARP